MCVAQEGFRHQLHDNLLSCYAHRQSLKDIFSQTTSTANDCRCHPTLACIRVPLKKLGTPPLPMYCMAIRLAKKHLLLCQHICKNQNHNAKSRRSREKLRQDKQSRPSCNPVKIFLCVLRVSAFKNTRQATPITLVRPTSHQKTLVNKLCPTPFKANPCITSFKATPQQTEGRDF